MIIGSKAGFFVQQEDVALLIRAEVELPAPVQPGPGDESADPGRVALLSRKPRQSQIGVEQRRVDDEPGLVETLIDHLEPAQGAYGALGAVSGN